MCSKGDFTMSESIRIKDTVVFREVDGDIVAMSLATGEYVGFDDVGSHIWRLIDQHGSLDRVREGLLRHYDIHENACRAELETFVAMLHARGLVTVEGDRCSPSRSVRLI